MTTTIDRRTVLAGAAATAIPAVAIAAVPTHKHGAIYAAIEGHKAAWARLIAALDAQCALERELPRELRQSHIRPFEREIVDTDDPRWDCLPGGDQHRLGAIDKAAWGNRRPRPGPERGRVAWRLAVRDDQASHGRTQDDRREDGAGSGISMSQESDRLRRAQLYAEHLALRVAWSSKTGVFTLSERYGDKKKIGGPYHSVESLRRAIRHYHDRELKKLM
jgi:hypothetical protein